MASDFGRIWSDGKKSSSKYFASSSNTQDPLPNSPIRAVPSFIWGSSHHIIRIDFLQWLLKYSIYVVERRSLNNWELTNETNKIQHTWSRDLDNFQQKFYSKDFY